MSRLLVWLAVIALVIMALRSKARGAVQRAREQAQPPAAPPEALPEAMARCAHCGLHFPVSESVRADGLDYCSPAHVRLPPK